MKKIILILVIGVMLLSVPLSAKECDVDKTQKNLVKFTSDAKIETFDGVTDKIDGYVLWPGDELTADADYTKSELFYQVELNGLDTGIGLRNRHMREIFLETDKYPYTHFKGKIDKVEKGQRDDWVITSSGILFIHGVEKQVTIKANVTKEGGLYHVASQFAVQLPDYNIKVPTLMFLKISETIQLSLDFFVKAVQK